MVRWAGGKQGQQGMSVWRLEGEAWQRLGRVNADVTQFTDKNPLPKGQSAYMVCSRRCLRQRLLRQDVARHRTAAAPARPTKINVTSFPTTAHRGTTAFIRAVTSPGAYLRPVSPPRRQVQASNEASADTSGAVTWSWPIAANAGAGSFSVKITCGATTVTRTLTID